MMEGMKKYLTLFCTLMVMIFSMPQASAIIKINDLIFDNSDNMILFKTGYSSDVNTTSGSTTQQEASITKGVLYNPGRVFFDINGAILTTPQKMWNLKNSELEEVKISQFSLSPDVVRVVLKYGKNKAPQNFDMIERNGQLILKYSNEYVTGAQYETVYRNFEDKTQAIFENTKGELIIAPIAEAQQPQTPDDPSKGNITIGETTLSRIFEKNAAPISVTSSNIPEYERKLTSKFFAAKATSVGDGIMLFGLGNINIKPAIILESPSRMVIDLQNAVLAQNLRNRTLIFNSVTTGQSPTGETIEQREVLRLGQFDKNIVRLVIQGNYAKDYRVVTSPDLQNLFIAKKTTILSTKLTQNSAKIESANIQNLDSTLDLITMNFTSPIAFSIFEEGGALHFDMQNVGDFNKTTYDEITKNPKFASVKLTKIAYDKTRLSFPLKNNININAQISNDGKSFRVYFKVEPPKIEPAQGPQPTIVLTPEPVKIEPPKIVINPQKFPRPVAISNYYKVVLDPGHGGSDTGAIREGINEKDINLPVAKIVRDILVKQKVDVSMTMETDKTVSLSQRVDFANEINPDIYVSIHSNSSLNDAIIGLETHWYHSESQDLAKKVHAVLASDKNLKKWDSKDRGLFKSQFYVINHTKMPAILVEIGFMSNTTELQAINSKKRQQEIAEAIAQGIMDYLKAQR